MKHKFVSIVTSVLTVLTVTSAPFSAMAADQAADYTIKDYTTAESFYNRVVLSKAWRQTVDRAERGEMVQLPAYLVDRLTTDALVEAVLDYPFFCDVYAFDDVQVGVDLMMEHFNGVQELADRDDVASVLLDKYCDEEVLTDASADSDVLRLTNMEILMSQDFVTTKFSKKEKCKFVKTVASKMEEKIASPVYGEYTNGLLFDLLENNSADSALLSDMAEARDRGYSSYVTTPNGTQVPTIANDTEPLTQAQINSYDASCASAYPNAVKLRSASKKYNCHSYAWYSTSSSNKHWMNNPVAYVNDGSYVGANSIISGRKAVYIAKNSPTYSNGFPIHSAIVYSYSNNVLTMRSKWGSCGLYRHVWNDSPYTYYCLGFFQRA